MTYIVASSLQDILSPDIIQNLYKKSVKGLSKEKGQMYLMDHGGRYLGRSFIRDDPQ